MNHILQAYARQWLKDNLAKLTVGNHDVFKRMYGQKNLDTPINQVVDDMAQDKLDWAMTQIENTLKKRV
jgi:hypothetical protein